MDHCKSLQPLLFYRIFNQCFAKSGITGTDLEHIRILVIADRRKLGAASLCYGRNLCLQYGTGDSNVIVGAVASDNNGNVFVCRQLPIGVHRTHIRSQRVLNYNFNRPSQHAARRVDLFFHQSRRIASILAFQRAVSCQNCCKPDFNGISLRAFRPASRLVCFRRLFRSCRRLRLSRRLFFRSAACRSQK